MAQLGYSIVHQWGVPGRVYDISKFQKRASNKIRFTINFEDPRKFVIKSENVWFVLFNNIYEKKMFKIEIEDGREEP